MTDSEQGNDRANNLIWIDLEMTGLDSGADTIIELEAAHDSLNYILISTVHGVPIRLVY